MKMFHIHNIHVCQWQNIFFFIQLTNLLGYPEASGGLLLHFDRQFPISYSYIFLKELEKQMDKSLLNK